MKKRTLGYIMLSIPAFLVIGFIGHAVKDMIWEFLVVIAGAAALTFLITKGTEYIDE